MATDQAVLGVTRVSAADVASPSINGGGGGSAPRHRPSPMNRLRGSSPRDGSPRDGLNPHVAALRWSGHSSFRSNSTAPIRRKMDRSNGSMPTMPARRFTSSFKRSPMELALSRFIPGALCCPGSEAIAPVEGERAGETSRERRDDPASPPLDARLFAHAACYHPPARGKPPAPSLDVVFHKDPAACDPGTSRATRSPSATWRWTCCTAPRSDTRRPLGTPTTSKPSSGSTLETVERSLRRLRSHPSGVVRPA